MSPSSSNLQPSSQWGTGAHEEDADSSSDSCPSPDWGGHLRRAPGSYTHSDGDHSSGSYTPTSSSESARMGRRSLSTIEEIDSDLQCSPLGLGLAAPTAAVADRHPRYASSGCCGLECVNGLDPKIQDHWVREHCAPTHDVFVQQQSWMLTSESCIGAGAWCVRCAQMLLHQCTNARAEHL